MSHEHEHSNTDQHAPETRPRLTRGKKWFLFISTVAIGTAWFFAERGWNPLNTSLLARDGNLPPASDPTEFSPTATPPIPTGPNQQTPTTATLANCPQGSVGKGIVRNGGAAWIAAEESIPDSAVDTDILDDGYLYHIYRRNGSYIGVINPVTWDITATDPNSEAVRDTVDGDFACAVIR